MTTLEAKAKAESTLACYGVIGVMIPDESGFIYGAKHSSGDVLVKIAARTLQHQFTVELHGEILCLSANNDKALIMTTPLSHHPDFFIGPKKRDTFRYTLCRWYSSVANSSIRPGLSTKASQIF